MNKCRWCFKHFKDEEMATTKVYENRLYITNTCLICDRRIKNRDLEKRKERRIAFRQKWNEMAW